MVTTKMLIECQRHPVLSRIHEWEGDQKAEYDSLDHNGRRLYDNLRTKFDVPHDEAFSAARSIYGLKRRISY